MRMAKAMIALVVVVMIGAVLVIPGPVSAQTASTSNWPNTAVVVMNSNQEPNLTTPVSTDHPPMGASIMQMTNNSAQVNYTLWVGNVANVTQATINMGMPGQQGAVVATLFPSANVTKVASSVNTTKMPGTFTGLLAKGTIMMSDLTGPLQGKNMSDIMSAINSGQLYVNVQTTQNPNGEIRGQINASDVWFNSLAVPMSPLEEPKLNTTPSTWNISGVVESNQSNMSTLVGKNLGSIPWGCALMHAGTTQLHYKLVVFNITNVTMAHFHMGAKGTEGPIVQWLYPSTTAMGPMTPANPGQVMNGKLAEGNVTAATFMGPLQNQTLSTLYGDMQNGSIYVNVHTTQNPNGEIRGQVDPANLTK